MEHTIHFSLEISIIDELSISYLCHLSADFLCLVHHMKKSHFPFKFVMNEYFGNKLIITKTLTFPCQAIPGNLCITETNENGYHFVKIFSAHVVVATVHYCLLSLLNSAYSLLQLQMNSTICLSKKLKNSFSIKSVYLTRYVQA